MAKRTVTTAERIENLEKSMLELRTQITTVAEAQEEQKAQAEEQTRWLKNGLGAKIAEGVNAQVLKFMLQFIDTQSKNKPSRKQITLYKLAESLVAFLVIGGMIFLAAALWVGKLSPEGAARIIAAATGHGG